MRVEFVVRSEETGRGLGKRGYVRGGVVAEGG